MRGSSNGRNSSGANTRVNPFFSRRISHFQSANGAANPGRPFEFTSRLTDRERNSATRRKWFRAVSGEYILEEWTLRWFQSRRFVTNIIWECTWFQPWSTVWARNQSFFMPVRMRHAKGVISKTRAATEGLATAMTSSPFLNGDARQRRLAPPRPTISRPIHHEFTTDCRQHSVYLDSNSVRLRGCLKRRCASRPPIVSVRSVYDSLSAMSE